MYFVTRSKPPCRLKLKIANAATTVTSKNVTFTPGLVIIASKPKLSFCPVKNLTK